MQKNKVVRLIAYLGIVVLTVLGLMGVIPLVRSELALGDVCPKIVGIRACFIILGCLIFITFYLFRIAKFGSKLFWIGTLIALSIATFGSVSNMIGYIPCPKTAGGTPMCYLSFLVFGGIAAFRLLEMRFSAS